MDRSALVYKGMPPNITCCDQALRILPPGEWVAIFMTGGSTEPELANFVALCRSSDEGETWGPLETVLQPEGMACTLTEVLVDGDRLTVLVNVHGGRFDRWTNYKVTSDDGGRSWSEPALFTPLPRRAFLRNRFICRSGEWILPYQIYPPTGDIEASMVLDGSFERMWVGTLVSTDEGRTWTDSARVRGIYFAENNVVQLSDGRLVMLARADGTGCLWRSESADLGRTWSELARTDIPNPGSKFRLWQLRDGRVVMVHNPNPLTSHPNSKPQAACNRNPLALWISDDDLRTWGYQRVLVDFPGHLAYPDGVVDEAEAFVHFVFDYNRHDVIYYGAKLP